jgi:16S rRNA (uracil1498-N3)-methyltransferase
VNARFFAPEAQAPDDVVALPAEEAQHLTRVLRLKRGDAVVVFNGRGDAFDATVDLADKSGAHVRVGMRHEAAREAGVAVTLAQAVLKGDKMDDVIRDAVMIGVAAIQPTLTARTEVTRAALERGHRRERWERVAISSAKQCGRAVVPPIRAPLLFDDVPRAVSERQLPGPALMMIEPGASVETVALGDLDPQPPREATVVIGPEGGWTPEEIAAAAVACRLVTIGFRTLRADAMATIAMAALFARWNEF